MAGPGVVEEMGGGEGGNVGVGGGVDGVGGEAAGFEVAGINIIETLKTLMLTLQLTTPQCFETMVGKGLYMDAPCLKLVSNIWLQKILIYV